MWHVAWVLLLRLADASRLLTGEVKPEGSVPLPACDTERIRLPWLPCVPFCAALDCDSILV